ncbi:MAG: NAD-dependent epimerase/dehydratase family protein [Pseudomonadota bacterium]
MTDAVAILGANGFVGQHLIRALDGIGVPVIAMVRDVSLGTPPRVEVHSGAFDRPEDFDAILARVRVVIHAASRSTPGYTAGRPLLELDVNVRPTLALLGALQRAPHCRLLYLSSGGTLYGDTHDRPAQEGDALRPRSYYGAGKASAEHFIHAAAMQFGLSAVILRPANLYGPGQRARSGFGIIPTAFECIRRGTELTLWGDGRAVRDYLYIDDFIRLCLMVLDASMPGESHVFNAGSGRGVSLNQLVDIIRHVTGRPLPVIHDTSRPVDVARIELDPLKAAKVYGWVAEVSLEEGVAQAWRWWQAQP